MKNTPETFQNPLLIDYRNDCWIGFKNVSLRLSNLKAGDRFTFICSAEQEAGIVKVISHQNGQIVERLQKADDIIMTASKKAPGDRAGNRNILKYW